MGRAVNKSNSTRITYDFDFEYTNDSRHYISVFEVQSGKIVAYADSVEEALAKIAELEEATA